MRRGRVVRGACIEIQNGGVREGEEWVVAC